MAPPSVLVTDTNIWIDLENGGVLIEVFGLPCQFLTPDLAIPELVHPKWQTLQTLGLRSQELAPALIQELPYLRTANRALSITDLAAFLIARLLDEMIRFQAITPEQAANALQQMLSHGARLPQDECQKRLMGWVK
jgi:hypothetical protein